MSFWDSVFADSHFAPLATSLPFAPTDNATLPVADDVSSLQYLVDVEPIGYTYDHIIYPQSVTYTVQIQQDDDIDPEELIDSIREADLHDYYSLLFLGHRQIVATEEEVKRNFKVINLYLHPDKADPTRRVDAEVRFKAIQKAYDTLTNPTLKLEYDSELPFDDSIPSARQVINSTEDFLRVYYPVFERNARFSKIKPVPMLGDEHSTEEQLNKFYKFWFAFQSWREFASADTEKVGDSASRDERRQAAAKNRKAREEHKKKEILRIRNLVQRASDCDPRMKAFRQQQRQEAAQKNTKPGAKGGQVAGKKPIPAANGNGKRDPKLAIAQIAAEKKRLEEEEKKRYIEKRMTEITTKLRGSLTRENSMLEKKELVETIVTRLTVDYKTAREIDEILNKHGYTDPRGQNGKNVLDIDAICRIIDEVEGREPKPEASEAADKRQWTAEELTLLAKATVKYPVGTKERWGKVAEFINTIHPKELRRTEKEVIREIKRQELAIQAGGEAELKKIISSTTSRAPEESSTPQVPDSVDDVESWTAAEQKLLEKGLMEIGKDVDDRWQLIANVVGTRTKAQCVSRFKYLREKVSKNKSASS